MYTWGMHDNALADLATKYNINPQKTFFPVNSLRLLYYLVSDHFTGNDEVIREKIGSLIPKVEAVIAARAQHRGSAETPTPESDLAAAALPLQDVYAVIDTPVVRNIFMELFSYLNPFQDELFLSLYQDIANNPVLTNQQLNVLLRIRAMDSIIFSTLINELIKTNLDRADSRSTALHYQLNLAYQINDLVDTVVFAKDDLASGSFSPFQVIRKIAPDPGQAKELIKEKLENFRQQATVFPFPEPLHTQVLGFYDALIKVVYGE